MEANVPVLIPHYYYCIGDHYESIAFLGEIALHFVVEDQDKGTADTPPEIAQVALEKSINLLLLQDQSPAVQCACVLPVGQSLPALHHQPPPDGVKGISQCLRGRRYHLSKEEALQEGRPVLFFFGSPNEALPGIISSEIEGSVGEDAQYGDREALIKPLRPILESNLLEAVPQALELSLIDGFANIGAKSGPGEVERVNKDQTETTSNTP